MKKSRFFLANPKLESTSIDAIITMDGTRYKKGIGVSVVTKYWDANRQLASVNQRYRDGALVNHELNKWSGAIERAVQNIELQSIKITGNKHFWKIVECEIAGVPYPVSESAIRMFAEYFETVFIPRFQNEKSPSRIQRFNVVLAKIKDFETYAGKHFAFDDIDISFYRDLQSYMNGLGHSANYFGTVIKIIKQVMREAQIIDKLHNNNDFQHSTFKAITQEVDKIYLTTAELEKIHRTPIDEKFISEFYPRAYPSAAKNIIRSYNIVKNRFLIGAYTGLRMSDFNRIDRKNISDGMITVVTEKTDQRVVIPIHPIVQEILDSGFDLSISLSDAKTRLYIKDICKFVKIDDLVEVRESVSGKLVTNRYPKWQLVGTHTARRSFATNAYKAGVPPISIMKITGHTKESTFMKYIRVSSEENAEMLMEHPFFK